MKSNIPSGDKFDLAMSFDEVLGLQLGQVTRSEFRVTEEIQELAAKREELRKNKKFDEADKIRIQIEAKGYKVEDSPEGQKVKKL